MNSGNVHLMMDCGGAIEEMAIATPPALFAGPSENGLKSFANLIASLPSELNLSIISEKGSFGPLRKWLEQISPACQVDIIDTPSEGEMTTDDIWIQDSFLVSTRGNRRVFVDIVSERSNSHARWLQAASAGSLEECRIHLAGGNMLVGPDFRIVGTDSIKQTIALTDSERHWKRALLAHQQFDSRHLSLFGYQKGDITEPSPTPEMDREYFQTPFHIDLAVSLTGLQNEQGKPILFVAEVHSTSDPQGPLLPLFASRLDASVARMEAQGFCVLRNKIPYVAPPEHLTDGPPPAWAYWHAYNNVIVENQIRPGEDSPRVWLPQFADVEIHLEPFDMLNRQSWESLGFRVVPVYGATYLARHGGSIRCATKILKRQEINPGSADDWISPSAT